MKFVWIGILTTITILAAQDKFQYHLPNYDHVRLENGFELILVENHSNPLVATIVVTRTGLRNETPENNGVSHMLEHLTFNGTDRRTQKQLYDELDDFGIYLNAQTSEDYTTYMVLNHKDQMVNALDIVSDMLFYSTFPEEKFEKEKGIIVEEIRKDSENPDFKKEQVLKKAFYKNPPYSLPVIGTIESVQNMTRDQVTDYYQKYYRPNNMIAMVIGDFDKKSLQQLIRKYFGEVPAREIPTRIIDLKQSFPFYYHEQDEQEQILFFKVPAPTFHSEAFIPFQFYYTLAFNDKNGKIIQGLKTNPDLKISKIQPTYEFHPEFGVLSLKVTFPPDINVESVKNAIIREFEKLQAARITPAEKETMQRSEAISEILETDKILYYGFLKAQELAIGGKSAFETIIPAMLQVKENQINGLIQSYSKNWSNPARLFTRSNWPENVDLDRYRYKAESNDRAESQIYRHTFPNGLTVLMMHNTDNPVLALHFLFKNRAAWEPETQTGIADFLHHTLFISSRNYPEDRLPGELQNIGAEIKTYDWDFIPYDDYYNVPEYSYIRILTLDAFFEKVLDVVGDNILYPDLEGNFDKVKQQMSALVARSQLSASQTARLNFFKILLGAQHPLSQPVSGTTATMQALQLEDLQAFHQAYFSAGNTILSVVSGLDSATVFSAIDRYFRNMPETSRIVSIPDIPLKKEGGRDSLELGSQQAYIYLGYTFPSTRDEEIALRVMNDMLSNQITFSLREQKGWAYRLGSSIDSWKNRYYFYTSMGTGRETTTSRNSGDPGRDTIV